MDRVARCICGDLSIKVQGEPKLSLARTKSKHKWVNFPKHWYCMEKQESKNA